MTDDDRPRWSDDEAPKKGADPEGVRIIGADEAEAALEREDVARRRGPDEPRPGDRPGRPPADAPEPVLRFPLASSASEDESAELPHWSDPPTGEFGAIGGTLFDDEAESDPEAGWSAFSSGAPRWRDGDEAWSDDEDVRVFGDDDTRVGALDDSDRPDPEDFFRFDEIDDPPAGTGRSVFDAPVVEDDADGFGDDLADEAEPEGKRTRSVRTAPGPEAEPEARPRKIVVGGGRITPGDQERGRPPAAPGGERDVRAAAGVGVGLVALATILFVMGPAWATLLVVAIVTLCAAEFFTKVQTVGYQPAALLGVVGTACVTIVAYHRGEAAVPVAVVLVMVFSMLWFLVGAGQEQAMLNIAVTLVGFVWIGVFGSFAASLLAVQGGEGIGNAGKGILFGAILASVAYDIGGYFVGRSVGHSHLSEASPNKTVEGLVGGMIAAVTVGCIYGLLTEPFGSLTQGFVLGLTVAIVAPLGDLCQSLIKRDLGVKDMGTILPGHGGFLDRFDGLLFVLPAVYYVAKLADFFT